MAWLRIDDGFAQHPKIVQLTPKDRWTWLEVLCYCARYRTDGEVPAAISEVVRGANAAFLGRCHRLGLLDYVEVDESGAYEVHDWRRYNPKDPTAADRVRKHRNKGVTETVTEPLHDRDGNGPSRAGARARTRPVPSPNGSTTSTAPSNEGADDDVPSWGKTEPERARAWLHHATARTDVTNREGYARASFNAGGWPTEPPPGERAIDTLTVCQNIIAGVSWDEATDWESMRDEFERLERKHGPLDPEQHHELHTLWNAEREKRYPAQAEVAT